MEPNYEALTIPELRFLVKYYGLRHYSELRKADLISLVRFHDASTLTFTAQKRFDPEENELNPFF